MKKSKKKVLVIAASLKIGGAEKVARDIALYANPDQYEFHYVVFGETIGAYEQPLQALGCTIFHFAEPSSSYPVFLKSMLQLMRTHRYDVVHAHNMFNCGFTMLLAAMAGVPIRMAHSHSALTDGGSLAKSIYEAMMQGLILSCSTDLVACGIKAGQRLYGKKQFAKRGHLILNGIDVTGFAYDPRKGEAVRKQLHAEDRWIMGHAGHLAAVKNQSFLLDLMPMVLEKKPNALLLMLGEGEDRPILEQKIRDMRLENHVIMTGNVTNVADYLSAMDVFVFPSIFEGLPLSILEVQANGLPCVISDSVPEDVFLTDLIHPLSLQQKPQQWVEQILSVSRTDTAAYNCWLQDSHYAVETAMEQIYQIYEKGNNHD